jgi:hypothetical protein
MSVDIEQMGMTDPAMSYIDVQRMAVDAALRVGSRDQLLGAYVDTVHLSVTAEPEDYVVLAGLAREIRPTLGDDEVASAKVVAALYGYSGERADQRLTDARIAYGKRIMQERQQPPAAVTAPVSNSSVRRDYPGIGHNPGAPISTAYYPVSLPS